MTAPEITIAFIIYLLVPFAGLMYYLRLYRLMKVENIPNAPAVGLFIIFATYIITSKAAMAEIFTSMVMIHPSAL